MTRIDTLNERLEELAFEETDNFCYGCYIVVECDNCPKCGTDDFMRHLDGVDAEELFEEVLDECYLAVEIVEHNFNDIGE